MATDGRKWGTGGVSYKNDYTGTATTVGSSIGTQLIPFYYQRKALIELKKEQFFGQLADTTAMPAHYGKTIKRYHYIPLLDDRNINDQGIDATNTGGWDHTIIVTDPDGKKMYFTGSAVGTGAANISTDKANAKTDAERKVLDYFRNLGVTYDDGDPGNPDVPYSVYATLVSDFSTWDFNDTKAPVPRSGNLWGSSKDIGVIKGKIPVISEYGGRVNRVGFTRLTIEANIANFGFFEEYTKDSVQFDNDPELMQHISRETLKGANEIVETMLQIDLLNGANVIFYGGAATSTAELQGDGGATNVVSEVTYKMLEQMDIALDENRCPKDTTIITGSRMTDTRTIPAARYMYVGPELRMTFLEMKDLHGRPAYIPVHQYANAGTLAHGEIGSCGPFRIIENRNMLHWPGAGATVDATAGNGGYKTADSNGSEKYNVYPCLVVGSGSFTTIGFQTSGKNTKFEIIHKKPSTETADIHEPFGKVGFYSIQWWYGTMILRPEWIALAKVVAPR